MGFFKDLFTPKAVVSKRPRTAAENNRLLKRNLTLMGAGVLLMDGSVAEKAAFMTLPLVAEAASLNHAMGYQQQVTPMPQNYIDADEAPRVSRAPSSPPEIRHWSTS